MVLQAHLDFVPFVSAEMAAYAFDFFRVIHKYPPVYDLGQKNGTMYQFQGKLNKPSDFPLAFLLISAYNENVNKTRVPGDIPG